MESRTDRRLPHSPSPYIRSESFSLNREYFGGGSRFTQSERASGRWCDTKSLVLSGLVDGGRQR